MVLGFIRYIMQIIIFCVYYNIGNYKCSCGWVYYIDSTLYIYNVKSTDVYYIINYIYNRWWWLYIIIFILYLSGLLYFKIVCINGGCVIYCSWRSDTQEKVLIAAGNNAWCVIRRKFGWNENLRNRRCLALGGQTTL